jgi:hypothetical protein
MILLLGIALLGVAFAIFWFVWPDPDAAEPEDLPELGASIDRAIALAAALPGDDVFMTKRTEPTRVAEVWAGMAEREYIPASRSAPSRIDTPTRAT